MKFYSAWRGDEDMFPGSLFTTPDIAREHARKAMSEDDMDFDHEESIKEAGIIERVVIE